VSGPCLGIVRGREARHHPASLWHRLNGRSLSCTQRRVCARPMRRRRRTSNSVFRADDGTRTHDLLHGKCQRPFAPVRARSLKPALSGTSVQCERTEANPSERRTLPSLPRRRAANRGRDTAVTGSTARRRIGVPMPLTAGGRANARGWDCSAREIPGEQRCATATCCSRARTCMPVRTFGPVYVVPADNHNVGQLRSAPTADDDAQPRNGCQSGEKSCPTERVSLRFPLPSAFIT
jgi:hypothetical protein